MKILQSLVIVVGISLLMPSCVVRPVRGGVAVSPAPGVGVYTSLPRGFTAPYYAHGGRYYYGGRWEVGRFHDHGRVYTGRYFHNGRHIYGGRFHPGHAATAPRVHHR